MKIGYARVSTQDQNINLQMDALKQFGCTTIYQEKKSGKDTDRPELLYFVSLQDSINTSTPQGMLFFHMMAALAEFERAIIKERTIAGLSSARARGRTGGRPKGLTKEASKTALAAWQLYDSKNFTIAEICSKLNISKPTLYRYINTEKII